MEGNGDLSLEEKLILDSQLDQRKFINLLMSKALKNYLTVILLDAIIFFSFLYFGDIFISPGFLLFVSSGVIFIMAGTIGTLGISVSIAAIVSFFSEKPTTKEEKKSKEERAIGNTMVYSISGALLFITSFFI